MAVADKAASPAGQATPDLLIAGAGVSGLWLALKAARAGLSVTLVERGKPRRWCQRRLPRCTDAAQPPNAGTVRRISSSAPSLNSKARLQGLRPKQVCLAATEGSAGSCH
ncbi:FAD-dependent oxidoreductase [Hoeflea alexandrii]